tara:strand:- start:243 stop:3293 length:3051 start_codon:yes stop_codon:yes gene_type:complete
MSKLEYDKQKNHSVRNAAIIFALILIGVYAPLIFLNQTYLINSPIPPENFSIESKDTIFGITIDYSMSGNYPNIKLSSDMILDGNMPLWNPYVGVGYPLFADTTHHVFSPFNLGFLLPIQFWDLPFLVILWIAGFSTFLFLRNLGLNFVGSITGGLFYMLSGCLTWYLPNPNPFVMFATPLILLFVDKTIQNKNPKYVILLSLSFGFSILGGHLQSLILQFLLISSYILYRLSSIYIIKSKISTVLEKPIQNFKYSFLRIFLGFLGGIGLTAFYILPVVEFFQNGILERDATFGSLEYNPITLLSAFSPYIIGPIHAYWTTNLENISLFGYSGIFALFFSLIGLLISIKNKTDFHRFTPLFFLLISSLSLMRLANVPIISWFSELPIFNVIYFGNYAGVLIPFGFAISAGFGVHYVIQKNISKKIIFLALSISLIIISILLIPVFNELFFEQNFPSYMTEIDARNYVLFQLLQVFIFLGFATAISIILFKKRSLIYILIPLILLELSLYVPFGLHPIWMAYKFLLIGILSVGLILFSKFYHVDSKRQKNISKFFIAGVVIIFFSGSLLISDFSPYGMPTKTNSFSENPVSIFLSNNLDNQRYFSFDYSMGPDYSAAFQISSIGKLSSFNIEDFYTFVPNFIDEDADPGRLGVPSWSNAYGPNDSIDKFFHNEKYFDFLGVKYIITEGYDFNTFSYGTIGNSGQFSQLSSEPNSFSQIFTSPVNSIESIGIGLAATLFDKNDQVIFIIDSIPYDKNYHRSSSINAINNGKINNFDFDVPLENIFEKKFQFTLYYPESTLEKFVVIYYDEQLDSTYDDIEFYEKEIRSEEYFIPFTIESIEKLYPVAFNFNNIYINENFNAFPRAFLVHEAIQVPVNQSQEFLLNHPEFDLRNIVILEESFPNDWSDIITNSTSKESDSVNIINFEQNKIKIQTNSDFDGILVLTDVFYPGWSATIDGNPAKIFKANGLVRSVFVPSGEHFVEFEYVPNSLTFGLIISVITLMILLVVYLLKKPKILI